MMHDKDDRISSFLDSQRRSLEDAFFLEEDKRLLEQLRTLRAMQETKESLAKASGIDNNAVLEKLVKLDIRPETVASLALVPLVEIAWADDVVDEKEKAAILNASTSFFNAGSIDHGILKQWMTHRPPARLLKAWAHYIQGLCERLTPEEKEGLRQNLLGHAEMVAKASGGLLGIGAISRAEKAMLNKLEQAFGHA